LTPPDEAEEPPTISTTCSPGLLPATQNQERERANNSTLGLVPKRSNQCPAISSKVGLAKPSYHTDQSWNHHGETTSVSLEEYKHHKRESMVRSPSESQRCDPSQTHIDHEVESVQQTQHPYTCTSTKRIEPTSSISTKRKLLILLPPNRSDRF
jgi:hypothetical protein